MVFFLISSRLAWLVALMQISPDSGSSASNLNQMPGFGSLKLKIVAMMKLPLFPGG
jgi:hypothetical protein